MIINNDEELLETVAQYRKVAICGTGYKTKYIQEYMENLNIKNIIVADLDSDHQIDGDMDKNKLPTILLDELQNKNKEIIILICKNNKDYPMISEVCQKYGLYYAIFDSEYFTTCNRKIFSLNHIYKIIRRKYKNINLILKLKFFNIVTRIYINVAYQFGFRNGIYLLGNTKMYLPYCPIDFIQRKIITNQRFFEEDILKDLDQYIEDNSIFLDVGSNIGNHSIYWAVHRKAKKIHAFEPVCTTFDILKINIAINNLESIVTCYNVGLSDIDENAEIISYNLNNTGGTSLYHSDTGELRLVKFDSFGLRCEKIDFIKIDVEGYELQAIRGMSETLKRYCPLVFIECFQNNYTHLCELMNSLGYKLRKKYPDNNYLWIPEKTMTIKNINIDSDACI